MFLSEFEQYLTTHFRHRRDEAPVAAQRLFDAIEYSLFSGGKRFRPQVGFAAAQALELQITKILPLAAAIEMVHTYSLIHDDLPCMDNDDLRRGKPTCHKAYGEATALLAGDALLTEAFYLLSKSDAWTPTIQQNLVLQLSQAVSATGMIGGQVLDLVAQTHPEISFDALQTMHNLKTGCLIQFAASSAAIVAQSDTQFTTALREYGGHLGFVYQLADDILDYDPKAPETSGFPKYIGLEATRELLTRAQEQGLKALTPFGVHADHLKNLLLFNSARKN